MSNFSSNVFHTLDSHIASLDAAKFQSHLVASDSVDFSRTRVWSFSKLMKSILLLSAKPLQEELFDLSNFDLHTATASSFVQARSKLLPLAFENLFHLMNDSFPCSNSFLGHRLIAVDGTSLPIPFDPLDSDTFKSNGPNTAGSNMLHINSTFDILNHRYLDFIINGSAHPGEQSSLWIMAHRFSAPAIFIADRNYASWNTMEHLVLDHKLFLIRSKDIFSKNSILRKSSLPDEEFDLDIDLTLTNKHGKDVKCFPDKFRIISKNSTFDFLDKHHHFHNVHYRVIRFKLDGNEEFESLITNLPRDFFPVSIIKDLYHKRWGIETSFKHLKYAVGLKALHARKRNSILQEIWASAIFYNLSFLIIDHAAMKLIAKKSNTYQYVLNVTRAIHLIRDLIKRKGGRCPPNLVQFIKEKIPIRPDRHAPRKGRAHGFVYFIYHFS